MIKINELRRGNLVYDLYEGNYIIEKVTGMGDSLLGEGILLENNNFYNEESLYPIPITPEILEQCGFEKARGQVTFWYYNTFSFRLLNNVLIYKIDSSFSIEIKSLHQLQNVLYAFTGEELTVNLTIEAKEV